MDMHTGIEFMCRNCNGYSLPEDSKRCTKCRALRNGDMTARPLWKEKKYRRPLKQKKAKRHAA